MLSINKKIISAVYLCVLTCPVFVMAQEPHSALDNKPSVDAASMPTSNLSSSKDVSINASIVEPEGMSEDRVGYVYDLKKLIIKSRENIKRVNDKIKEQAVIKRNQKREERAREYYQQGMQLNDEGKFDQAREYFEKAVRLTEHPEMTQYIQQSQLRLKAQEGAIKREEIVQVRQQELEERTRLQEAQQNYETAVRFYREKKYREAKDQFEHVDEISADFKATRSYLRILDQDIIQMETLAQKQQKVEIQRQQAGAEEARLREKEQWKKEIDRKEEERRNQVDKQAMHVYEEALILYKEKKFAEAKKKFQEVEWVVPDYKATRNYLERMDRDVAEEEKRLAIIKQKELEQQRWEEEVVQRKQEEEQKRFVEQKEKEHRKQLEEEASFVYQAALILFDKKLLDEALERFNDIEKTMPGFKSTRVYMAKIKQIKEENQRQAAQEEERQIKIKALNEEKSRKDLELARQKEEQEKIKEQRRQIEEETEQIYLLAIELFDKQDFALAKAKFIEVTSKIQRYKRVEDYLRRVEAGIERQEVNKQRQASKDKQRKIMLEAQQVIEASQKNIKPVVIEKVIVEKKVIQKPIIEKPKAELIVEVKKALIVEHPPKLSKEQELQEAKEIEELARKSSQLFQQISLLADDKRILPAKKKMAQVEQVLNTLKAQKTDLLRQIRNEEERVRRQELKRLQDAQIAKVGQMYDEAILLLRNRQFDEARAKFVEAENIIPNFKSVRQYLSRIEEDRKQAESDAVLERTRAEERRLKELQEKQRAEELARIREKEDRRKKEEYEAKERERKLKQAQQEEIVNLAQKAAILNDDILSLSKVKDFQGAKNKFVELEEVLRSLQAIKKILEQEEEQQQRARFLVQQKDNQHIVSLKGRKEEIYIASRRAKKLISVEHRPKEIKEASPAHIQALKRRELLHQQEVIFAQAVELFEQRKYSVAKLIFDDLVARGDERAKLYIRKIEHALNEQVRRVKLSQEQQRGNFLVEQLNQQRLVKNMQEKERIRQRGLTQELDRQRKLAEVRSQREHMRQESMRMRQKERQRMEKKQLRQEIDRRKHEEIYAFRKVNVSQQKPKDKPKVNKKPVKLIEQKLIEPVVKIVKPIVEVPKVIQSTGVPPVVVQSNDKKVIDETVVQLTPRQRKEQIEISNKRKKALEEKYKKEQLQKEKEARLKEIQERKQKKVQEIQDLAKKKQEEIDALKKANEDKLKQDEQLKQEQETKRQEQLKLEQDQEKERQDKLKKESEEKLKEEQDQKRQKELKALQDKQDLEKKRQEDLVKKQEDYKKELERVRELAKQKEKDRIDHQKQQALDRQQKMDEQTKARESQRLKLEQQRQERMAAQAKANLDAQNARQENERKAQLERQSEIRQKELENQRQAIEQKLIQGADAMYQDAMQLFKNGQFSSAASKFQDIEDILPDYKQTRDMIKKSHINFTPSSQ